MYNILIFGDSIAIGRNVQKTKSWPILLSNYIDCKDKKSILVYNLSVAGNSTKDIILRLFNEIRARCNKKKYLENSLILIFAIGINDSKNLKFHNKDKIIINHFISNIKKIISIAGSFSGEVCFLGLNPVDDLKMCKECIPLQNKRIKRYNSIIKNVCRQNNVTFIDVFNVWFGMDYKKLLSNDGMHPNSVGHKKIFKMLISQNIIKTILDLSNHSSLLTK